LISVLTAVTVVIGIKMMGAMLISSLIIFPALTSMRVFKSFLSVTICSAILSVINFSIGLLCSYAFSIPAGASVVVANLIVFLIFTVISMIKKH
ncbi:MAG: metal ABC transporter permease, partial [Eubacterium sp.]|nr:metal ABC transporter permease [Eubacterium sp.]